MNPSLFLSRLWKSRMLRLPCEEPDGLPLVAPAVLPAVEPRLEVPAGGVGLSMPEEEPGAPGGFDEPYWADAIGAATKPATVAAIRIWDRIAKSPLVIDRIAIPFSQ